MTHTEKPETVEDLARVALGRVRCRVPQPSYSHDDSGCEACRLQARIAAALRSYGDQRALEVVQKAARAVCRQCEGKALKQYAGGDFYHLWGGYDYPCLATAIHRLATEEGKPK